MAEAELLHEERKADGDLFASRPGGGVNGFALETRDAINAILGAALERKQSGKKERNSCDKTNTRSLSRRDPGYRI
ncbi:MAG: hypothetical protein Q8M72_03935 [Methylocystis sp.]|nr:hypothetical protein [Methylocystis sp.]